MNGTLHLPEAAWLRVIRVPCRQFWDGATILRIPPRATLGHDVGRMDVQHMGVTLAIPLTG